eukprot:349319_1
MMFYPSLSMAKIPALRSYSASFLRIFSSLAPSPELGVSELSKLNHDLQNSSVPILDPQGRAYGTGRRKCAVARIWLKEGKGAFRINGRSLHETFSREAHQDDILAPLRVVGKLSQYDVRGTVKGGGATGQAGAVRHGLARAISKFAPELRPMLKPGKFLTRDSRMVEPKKPGKPKARKSKQWVKR